MIFLFIDVLFLCIDVSVVFGTVFQTRLVFFCVGQFSLSHCKALFLWIDAKLASAIQLIVETVFFQ